MELKVKHIVFLAVFCYFSCISYSQNYPPEPMMSDTTSDDTSPCEDDGTEFTDPDGNTIPPPVGLCMPINDYLYPLLVLGILLGAYNIYKIERV